MIYVDYDLRDRAASHGTRIHTTKGMFGWPLHGRRIESPISILKPVIFRSGASHPRHAQESAARSFSNRGSGWDVWFVEDTQCKLSKFDPETQKFTDYEPLLANKRGVGQKN